MRLPISLIIDDAAPLLNLFWWHAAERQRSQTPVLESGEPVARAMPMKFVADFAKVVEACDMRGKFSVVPFPAGLGRIRKGWPGCNRGALERWLNVARLYIAPRMDITPEMLTHTRAVELSSMTLLAENERDWATHQTETTLTPYIAAALRFLNEVGLKATGVTSPWNFGSAVEPEYQRAILNAMRNVNDCGRTWYFLHTDRESLEFRSRVVLREGEDWLVSIVSRCDDLIWPTMEMQEDSTEYARTVADGYLTRDGRSGRLARLFETRTPIIFHTHWQSLYSNGRRTGLRVLYEVGRRIQHAWGEKVRWVKCSELAKEIARDEWPTAETIRQKLTP